MEAARACSNNVWLQQPRVKVAQLTPGSGPRAVSTSREGSSNVKLGAVRRRFGGRFSEWQARREQRCGSPGLRAELPQASERPSPPPLREDSIRPVSVVNKDGKVEGVIQVEQDASSPQPTWGRIYALGAGDLAFLLLFAAVGRLSHGFSVLDWETVKTADPFMAGWLMGSYFLGGYGPEGQGLYGLKTASLAAVKSWAVGIPLALAIRGFTIGHVPPTPFMAVSLASTFVLQVGWRTAFASLFPNDDKSFQKKMTGNRKGSVFEFFQLLSSLVKRW